MRLIVLIILLFATNAEAQTSADCVGALSGVAVKQPTTVTFTASADHSRLVEGSAVLTGYRLVICVGSTLARVVDINKPTPNASNVISAPLPTDLSKNVSFYLRVQAVGPGGAVLTPPTLPFVWVGPPAAAGSPTVQ
jgi:hypothetical protein